MPLQPLASGLQSCKAHFLTHGMSWSTRKPDWWSVLCGTTTGKTCSIKSVLSFWHFCSIGMPGCLCIRQGSLGRTCMCSFSLPSTVHVWCLSLLQLLRSLAHTILHPCWILMIPTAYTLFCCAGPTRSYISFHPTRWHCSRTLNIHSRCTLVMNTSPCTMFLWKMRSPVDYLLFLLYMLDSKNVFKFVTWQLLLK